MNEQIQNDLNQLDTLRTKVKDQGLDYLNNLDHRYTSTKNTIIQNGALKVEGTRTVKALQQFKERFEPVMVASSAPRYWGFVIGGSTTSSIVGDWLCSVYDQNAQNTKGHGDISA